MTPAGKCWKCRCDIWLPDELYQAAKKSSSISIHCGYGHAGIFSDGPTEEDKLRSERDRLRQRIAQKDDEIRDLENRRRAAIGQVTKLKNRVSHGVCPCCNRTFENLQRHMASKHPTFTAEAAE